MILRCIYHCLLTLFVCCKLLIYNQSEACLIRVSGCSNKNEQIFIEVNSIRLFTEICFAESSNEHLFSAFVTPSCKFKQLDSHVITGSRNYMDDFEQIYFLWQQVPHESYFVMTGSSRLLELWMSIPAVTRMATENLINELNLVYGSRGELISSNEHLGTDVEAFNSSMILIARKSLTLKKEERISKVFANSRVVEYYFETDDRFCVDSIQSLDRILFDNQRLYGENDRSIHQVLRGSTRLNLVVSDPIMCENTPIIGWEFIPANTGRVYFTVMRRSLADQTLTNIASTQVLIKSSMITGNLDIQYKCLRETPILDHRNGDLYGYYKDSFTAHILPPIKRAFSSQFTHIKYPCTQQLTWADMGVNAIYNLQSTDFPNLHSVVHVPYFEEMPVRLALKPIMDRDFVYSCECHRDLYCRMYGDEHMKCDQGLCVCQDHYVYNRKHNRCLYTKAAAEQSAYQSSTMSNHKANNGIDDNLSPSLVSGTFSMTEIGPSPWWVMDIGFVANVYAVQITTPQALDGYAEIWSSAVDYAEKKGADHILINNNYQDLQNSLSVDKIQVFVTHGPYSWRIENGEKSHILNSGLLEGEQVYIHSEEATSSSLGTVGQDIRIVHRLDKVGYLHLIYEDFCIGHGLDFSLVSVLDNQTCGEASPSLAFRVYVLEKEQSYFYIIGENNQHLAAYGEKVILTSEAVTVRFFRTSSDRDSLLNANVEALLDSSTGVLITLSQDVSLCLQLANEQLKWTSACSTKFFLKELFPEQLPRYRYKQVAADPSKQYVAARPVSELGVKWPCLEIVRPLYKGNEIGGTIATVHREFRGDKLFYFARNINGSWYGAPSTLLLRDSEFSLHDFTIGVSLQFNVITAEFIRQDFSQCVSHEGAPPHGQPTVFDCEKPVPGRYVGIYYNRNYAFDRLMLSNVAVYTLPVSVKEEDDKLLTLANECQDINHGCQHLCIHGSGNYSCGCRSGYQLDPQDGKSCLDVDECSTGLANCQHGCNNTEGSFRCTCSEGYNISPNGRECDDVNECQDTDEFQSHHLCSQFCYNTPGSYVCHCNGGYDLAPDGISCVGQHHIRLQCGLAMNYSESLSNTSSPQYQALAEQININLRDILCTDVGELERFHPLSCAVDGPFDKHGDGTKSSGGVIFQFIVRTANIGDDVNDENRVHLSYLIGEALTEHKNKFIVNKEDIRVSSELQYVHRAKGEGLGRTKVWSVDSECMFYEHTGRCQNGGECRIGDYGKPYCKCPVLYYGPDCAVYINIPVPDNNATVLTMSLLLMLGILVAGYVVYVYIAVLTALYKSSEYSPHLRDSK